MSQEENKEEIDQENNDKEKAIIWDLEVWKRAEQTQFKAYLKQLEFEHLSKLQEDFRNKENEREKEFKLKINEINDLKNKLNKLASQLESRECKIKLTEDKLQLQINETSKQLSLKEEEIDLIKKNAKDEQIKLQKNIGNKDEYDGSCAIFKCENELCGAVYTYNFSSNSFSKKEPHSDIFHEIRKDAPGYYQQNIEILKEKLYITDIQLVKVDE